MGKNTMMKRSIRLFCERSGDDTWGNILSYLVGNVGLVFTKGDLNEIRDQINSFKVQLLSFQHISSRLNFKHSQRMPDHRSWTIMIYFFSARCPVRCRLVLQLVWAWLHRRMSWSQLATLGLIRRRLTSFRCARVCGSTCSWVSIGSRSQTICRRTSERVLEPCRLSTSRRKLTREQ